MNIYIAARYSRKDEVRLQASKLREAGFHVTATWFDEPHGPSTQLADVDSATLLSYARRDLHEIDDADVMIFYSESDQSYNRRGGRHVEFGYALAKDKRILVIGPYENIFHYAVSHFETIEEVLEWLLVERGPMEEEG